MGIQMGPADNEPRNYETEQNAANRLQMRQGWD